jgi:hypothetical protein
MTQASVKKFSLFCCWILISFLPRILIPRNRFGDKIIAWRKFFIKHKRFPTKELIFNDVLYGIKTTDEIFNPLRVFVTDKEFVKIFIKAVVGDHYNVPTIAILNTVQDVENFSFPPQCAIKPTHASGMVILRKNGENVDLSEIRKWFGINYYDRSREANYKTLKPKVIVEPLIFNNSNIEDYKFFCYDGSPRFIKVDFDRREGHKRKFFDCLWKELDFSFEGVKSDKKIEKPNNFDEMFDVASALCKSFSMIRVDLYSDGTRIYVGELTNCNGGAGSKFNPPSSEVTASTLMFQNKRIV